MSYLQNSIFYYYKYKPLKTRCYLFFHFVLTCYLFTAISKMNDKSNNKIILYNISDLFTFNSREPQCEDKSRVCKRLIKNPRENYSSIYSAKIDKKKDFRKKI